MGDELLHRFQQEHCRTDPENAGLKHFCCALVVEKCPGFLLISMHVKIITHDQHDINVIGIRGGGDVTPKEDEAIQFACGSGQMVDTQQACCDRLPLRGPTAKPRKHFVYCHLMHSFGQVSCAIEIWQ